MTAHFCIDNRVEMGTVSRHLLYEKIPTLCAPDSDNTLQKLNDRP